MTLRVNNLVGFGVGGGGLTALDFIDATTNTGGGTGTQTLYLPTGSQEGDLMILMGATIGNNSDLTLPYSLTKLYTLAGSSTARIYIGAKILGSSESSTDTWSVFTTTASLGLLTFRPNISLSGFASNGESGDTQNGADPSALSLDLSSVTEPCLKVGLFANQNTGASLTVTPSMTSRINNGRLFVYADFYAASPVSQTTFDQGSGTNVSQALAYLTFT